MFQPVKISSVKPNVPNIQMDDDVFVPNVQQSAFMPASVKPGKMTLPPEAAKMVPGLIKELMSGKPIIDFGEGATVKVAEYADKMLDHVSMRNIGDFQKPLTDILALCATVNTKSITSGQLNSRIPFINKARLWFADTKVRAISNINSVRGQIDDIVKEIIKKEADLRRNIEMMEEVYLMNMQEYYSLMAHVEAIEHVIKTKSESLKAFTAEFESSGSKDPLVGLEIRNRQDELNALDKKLYDLRAISLNCIDTAPMIRDEQKTSNRSIEKFKSVRSMAIPLWKKQAMLTISSLMNKDAAILGNSIDDATNKMVLGNASQVSANSIASAKLGERGVIDLSTMEKVNEILIETVKETIKIEDDGRAHRAHAATRFEELKMSLNQNVVSKGRS